MKRFMHEHQCTKSQCPFCMQEFKESELNDHVQAHLIEEVEEGPHHHLHRHRQQREDARGGRMEEFLRER